MGVLPGTDNAHITKHSPIFADRHHIHGGDGVTNFALPNLTGDKAMTDASGAALNWIIALAGIYRSRD
jgi:microcystin-dependent protein